MSNLFSSHEQQTRNEAEEFLPPHHSLAGSAFELVHKISWQIDPEMVRTEVKRYHQRSAGRVATAASQETTAKIIPFKRPQPVEQRDVVNGIDVAEAYRVVDANSVSTADSNVLNFPIQVTEQKFQDEQREAAA
ncbi:MAG: hypothetical protein JWN82_148 [Candidatus Saccharibacteria bacterium]|nr:hypothetical protein [Candidatus Saccharibacteria bacterium]